MVCGKLLVVFVGFKEIQSFDVVFLGVYVYLNIEFDVIYKFFKGEESESLVFNFDSFVEGDDLFDSDFDFFLLNVG